MGIKKFKQRIRKLVLTADTRGDVSNGFPAPASSDTRASTEKFKQRVRGPVIINQSKGDISQGFPAPIYGTTNPVLTSPLAVANGPYGGELSVVTDKSSGTLFWYVTTSLTPPDATALKAGTGAADYGSDTVVASGIQFASPIGLNPATEYYSYFLHNNGADSDIAAADPFTTDAAPADATYAFRNGHDVSIPLTSLDPLATGGSVTSGTLPAGLAISSATIVGLLSGASTQRLTITLTRSAGGDIDKILDFDIDDANSRAPDMVATHEDHTTFAATSKNFTGVPIGTVADGTTRTFVVTLVAIANNIQNAIPTLTIGGNAMTRVDGQTLVAYRQDVFFWSGVIDAATTTLALSGLAANPTLGFQIACFSMINGDDASFDVQKVSGSDKFPLVSAKVPDKGMTIVHSYATSNRNGTALPNPHLINIIGIDTVVADQDQHRQIVGYSRNNKSYPLIAKPVGYKSINDVPSNPDVPETTSNNVLALAITVKSVDSVQTVPGILPLTALRTDTIKPPAPVVGEAQLIDLRVGHYGWTSDVTYALAPGSDALPFGAISGYKIEGIPTGSTSATTVTVRATRTATSETCDFTFTIPATVASSNLASGAPDLGVTETPITNGYSADISSTGNQHIGWTLTLDPAKTYRIKAALTPAATVADNQDVWLRLTGSNTVNQVAYEGDEPLGMVDQCWVAGGASQTFVEMVVRPKQATNYLLFGRLSALLYNSGTSQLDPATASNTISIVGLTVEEVAPTVAIGGTATVVADRYRDGPTEFIFNRAVNLRRCWQGEGFVQQDDGDPVEIIAITPVSLPGGTTRSAQPVRVINGAHQNWGATKKSSGLSPTGNGWDAGGAQTYTAVPYDPAHNVDPHNTGAPITLTASENGKVGSLIKARSQIHLCGENGQHAIQDNGVLYWGPTMPEAGRVPFAPCTAIAKQAWLYTDIITDALAGNFVQRSRPGSYYSEAAHLADIDYFLTTRPQTADGHAPFMKCCHFGRHRHNYRRGTMQLLSKMGVGLFMSDISLSKRKDIMRYMVQVALQEYGWVASGGGYVPGGASGGFKHPVVLAALWIDEAAQAALKTALGVSKTMSEIVDPAALTFGTTWTPWSDDSWVVTVPAALVDTTLTDFSATQAGRPRATYRNFHLGMAEARNHLGAALASFASLDASGANKMGDWYRGTQHSNMVGLFLTMLHYPGAQALWNRDAYFDYMDRHVALFRDGTGGGGDAVTTQDFALYDAVRSLGGEPVATQMRGLVATGTQGSLGAGNAETATDIPVPENFPDGVPTDYDAADLFVSAFPITSASISQCYDASMSPISTPAWITGPVGTTITVTSPDTSTLVFVDIVGTNANGSATARIAIKGS